MKVCGDPEATRFLQPHIRELIRGAVTVLLRYPLMPEVRGKAILERVDDVVAHVGSDGFKADMMKRYPNLDIQDLIVSGPSAGGFLAAYISLWSRLPIKVLYMQYPMLEAYRRKSGQQYRGQSMKCQDAVGAFVSCMRLYGKMPERNHPPERMEMCFALSSFSTEAYVNDSDSLVVTPLWHIVFGHQSLSDYQGYTRILDRNDNLVTAEAIRNDLNDEDIFKMENRMGIVFEKSAAGALYLRYKQDQFPPHVNPHPPTTTVIMHGIEDIHCPIEESERHKAWMEAKYPTAKVELYRIEDKGHGFDTEEGADIVVEHVLRRVQTVM
jgi:acetyl esterase/lipase